MRKSFLFALLIGSLLNAPAQLSVSSGAEFYLQENAKVYVEGDLSSMSDIKGPGYIHLIGRSRIHMSGLQIGNLVINSKESCILTSPLAITSNLILLKSKLELNGNNVFIHGNANISGSGKSYIQTSGGGYLSIMLSRNRSEYFLPIGTQHTYMPCEINNVKYEQGLLQVSAIDGPSSKMPVSSHSFLKAHWILKRDRGMDNVIVTGFYLATDVQGDPSKMHSVYWNGQFWVNQQPFKSQKGKATTRLLSESGELFVMNDAGNAKAVEVALLNNPARQFTVLQIRANEQTDFRVILRDVLGRELKHYDITVVGVSQHVIDLNRYSPGVYFFDVASFSFKQRLRFIKVDR